jgi:LmbE family N-acetylglucosaminyl deacetylase
MKFHQPDADIFVPGDGMTPEQALKRTTHLCVVAHQDDIEIMAYAGIATCLDRHDRYFTGVVVTDGAGSPRAGPYAGMSDLQMRQVRRDEQRKAAMLGGYSLQVQLAYPSAEVKKTHQPHVHDDLLTIFSGCMPEIVYLHQPADKHDTHVAVFLRCLEALRALPRERRPQRVLGCEAWRDLDWLDDEQKVALDASPRPALAANLVKVFDSQIAGGKRYDIAALGRRAANATFHTSHAVDQSTAISWAMDLTPLIRDETLSPLDFTLKHVDRLRSDVSARLRQLGA